MVDTDIINSPILLQSKVTIIGRNNTAQYSLPQY